MMDSLLRRLTPAAVLLLSLLAGCSREPDPIDRAAAAAEAAGQEAPSLLEIKQIAEEGLIFGLPIVMNYAVQYQFVLDPQSPQYKAPYNQIYNLHRVFTYKDTAIVTPNSDTPYSMLWLDLRAEPQVVSVPAVDPKRYYSVQMVDASTYNYGYIGSRATGSEAGDYLVVGPNWQGEVPPGLRGVFRSGSDFSLLIFRTQLFNPQDMPNVIAVQEGYRAKPLSAWLGQPAPAPAAAIDWPVIDADKAKSDFFHYLAFALQFIPPAANEQDIRAKLARIGVVPGQPFAFDALSPLHKAAILLGLRAGNARVEEQVGRFGQNVNGWRVGGGAGPSSVYDGNWLTRAMVAKAGIYANDEAEAVYPLTKTLANGDTLDTSRHNYSITFPAGQLPPVNSFWSITLYDAHTQLLIKNPIDRYLINSPMLPQMKTNADGSLTLYIQKDSPGKAKETNWLPAPDGPIYLVMRLYWPKSGEPSILPAGKGTWAPPGIQLAE